MRDLSAEMIAKLESGEVRPIFFFEGEFQEGTLRLWTGRGQIGWNEAEGAEDYIWEGNGLLQGFDPALETKSAEATGINMMMSGVSEAVLQMILITGQTGKPGKIWLGFLDDSEQIVDTPCLLFKGGYDTSEIIENPREPEVTIKYESRLIELERGRDFRYTPESQKLFSPADKGFDYVAGLQEWDGFWGNRNNPPAKKDTNKGAVKKNRSGRR